MMPPVIGAGSVLGMSTLEDAQNELASAKDEQQRASIFFCPAWSGFPAWKAQYQKSTDALNAEAANINSAAAGAILPASVKYYDDSTINDINLQFLSLNAQVQTVADQCKTVPPATPGSTPNTPPGGNQNKPPPGPDATTSVLIAVGIGVALFGGYWLLTRQPAPAPRRRR